ncbi:glycosyltransferase [Ramlibacter sp. H39-3-26]|uniref:glycosyltransferase n=1 Tax=Curvibacter soli TaxID=3031331 RepID=UPI0023DC3622|nr:glycosyltransferase [Ramlibacter sp. H39-3-26]MDF1485787.1 glycosyltransferase [Ramlibacter sp. H39-3-26]
MPAYKARFLDAALRSAVEQEFDSFEIVICDDCRTDAVAAVVQPYLDARDGPPVRYFHNSEQLREGRNFSKCIELARGAYVKFLCDDDLLLPGTLAAQAAVLDAHPGVSLVASRRQLVNENGAPLADIPATRSPFEGDVCVHGHDLASFLADHVLNFIGEPTSVMFRREQILPYGTALMGLGGQPIEWLGDLAMHVNLMRAGHLAMLEQPGASFRISSEQVSHAGRTTPGIGKEGYANFSRMIRELGWYRSTNNHMVRVAPLGAPSNFQEIDLGTRIDRMLRGEDPVNPLRRWLAQRVPTASQARLIETHLDQNAQGPSITIFVRDFGSSPEKLTATLDSLAPGQCLYTRHAVAVLTDAREHVPHAGVRHVPATPDDYLPALNQLAAESDCDWLLVVDAGEIFTSSGLLILALELLGAPGIRAVYADEMMRAADGTLAGAFRPGFDLDMLLSCPTALARHWLVRRDVFVEAGGFDPACTDAPEFDLLLRLVDAGGITGLGHVDEPLLITDAPQLITKAGELAALQRHLQGRGYMDARIEAQLPGRYRVLYGHADTPMVSIIVPTKDQFVMLQRCVETLIEKTAYKNYELLIVDNNSTAKDACIWLDGMEAMNSDRIRILRYPHPFNYSAINNMAAREARGDYLVLLNNDTAILREDWLDALLNHAQRPEVGITGAKLLYPDGRIQHAGVVLGLRGPAEHPFSGYPMDAAGYMHRLQIDQNYNAVTGACLMIRRSVFDEVAGLDEDAFKVSYNDVDLCLKVRQAGYLVVWTPHAVLLHEGSVSQNTVDTAAAEAKRQRFQGEQDALYAKWLPTIARDTAYNQNLSLKGIGFEPETDSKLNWHPLVWRPLPVVLALAADQAGCGHYRLIQPVKAINAAGLATAQWDMRYYSPVEMERLSPDTLVLQRQFTESLITAQRQSTRFSRCFKVAEVDDYLPNVPIKSAHHGHLPKDILKTMRKALALVDRFIVSTAALAEAFDGLHPDIRVVENHLPLPWWQNVQGLRRQGAKPRVGWAGGIGHRGDLELITDIVKALAGEVEWVFCGMCPDALRPYVHEFHAPVPIDDYPSALAGLNLDLALAPLEHNLFNECKSNLRLLEYGACGFPVVCSDIRPYQGSLPVTRVKQRFKDWMDAIRMHTTDLDAAAKAGDALRAAVQRDWMLDNAHLSRWLAHWLP